VTIVAISLFAATGVFAGDSHRAAMAQVNEAVTKINPTVSFTGAPASAMNQSTFVVTATTNASTAAVLTVVQPAPPATAPCEIVAGSTTTNGTTVSATVMMTANTGTCRLNAKWAADSNYLGATLTQKTTATTGYTTKVIYNFGVAYGDGVNPAGNGMVMDKSGVIYGSTAGGGFFQTCSGGGDGAIFQLVPDGNGGWTETHIHNFDLLSTGDGIGCVPTGPLAIDSKGNLYGTTEQGGKNNCTFPGYVASCGTVYKLSLVDGVWTETTLYSFGASSTDGYTPSGGVTLGNSEGTVLYGTTGCGGAGKGGGGTDGVNTCVSGAGTVWELKYTNPGGWTETILHNFAGDIGGTDGWQPQGGLLLNGGNLYGFTSNGGAVPGLSFGVGIVFELTPPGSGEWTENVLYTFGTNQNDGADPGGTPAMDINKNIYGTTAVGFGARSGGTAWKLAYSPTHGTYSEQILYSFNGDAENPNWGLVYSKGSWFGTTGGWGNFTDGNVFKLTYSAKTGWTETTVYSNFANVTDGSEVDEPGWNQLIVDKSGNLYGMGHLGGYSFGGVFEVSPTP
jgi:hypothetical protein